ncbi:MAG: hypothetical protein ILP02_01090 [Clostridia bacterium]|nr:hypothetical protein [Clostridia bacterium]
MYNNGQFDVNDNGYQTQRTDTRDDYYRNDVPASGGGTFEGDLEDRLFYSRAQSQADVYGAQAAKASPARSQTVYAEPEREVNDYYSQPAVEEVFDEDAYPSVTTMQFREREANPYEDYREDNETYRSSKYKITTKGKVLVAVYALVIATILMLIILNTRLLKNMNAQIAVQQTRITTLHREAEALSERLENVSSDQVVGEKAREMGMIHD